MFFQNQSEDTGLNFDCNKLGTVSPDNLAFHNPVFNQSSSY
jgi:hypothetical protein